MDRYPNISRTNASIRITRRFGSRTIHCRWAIGLLSLLVLVGLPGCAGYRAGSASLFRPDVQTVAVPVIESESLRPFLGERLTEAVIREIHEQTPYRVASLSTAQSVLRIRLLTDSKHILGENVNDEPRDIQIGMLASVSWTNRLGEPLTRRTDVTIDAQENFVPEGGQSMVTAQQDVIDKLAKQIVASLESEW